MYTLVLTSKGTFELRLDGRPVADFYCRITGDLVCNLLNVTNAHVQRSPRCQAG